MKTLRLQLRFLLPLTVALVGAAYIALPLLDQVTLRWFSRDLNSRGALMVNAMSEAVSEAMAEAVDGAPSAGPPDAAAAGPGAGKPGARPPHHTERLATLLDRAVRDERLFAIAACDAQDHLLHATRAFPEGLGCARSQALASRQDPRLRLAGGAVHVGVYPVLRPTVDASFALPLPASEALAPPWPASAAVLAEEGPPAPALAGRLVLLHDMSFIEKRSQDTRRYLVGFIASLGFVVALITMIVAQVSWRGWVKGARAILRGDGLITPPVNAPQPPPELAPIVDELRTNLRDLEDEYRRMQGPALEWTGERLRQLLQTQLRGDQVIVVSNREPYVHERGPDGVVVRRPASGLVTAVEPVMRACSGTWIAHGSGSADREVVDAYDRVGLPPGLQDYQLRRIWLTPEEEQGYYYGFANEGLWPLCHVAHVRPVFREPDWETYRLVNQRFADAVVAEARSEDPVVLVQDYHFALLPAMIRARLPQATILTFWHIPWPNPESFGICPWNREILQGLLGSTILGFHTRFHCRNFMETVDRYLEARIEAEVSTISFQDKETLVASYPISIEWPDAETLAQWPPVPECRRRVAARLGLPAEACLAVGIDRFDYTKGILERLNAVERLLEKAPEWVGRFVFVQVAAPTRSSLDEYRSFQERVERAAERINTRFARAAYQPVHLLAWHHEPDAVNELFRATDILVVTSLHDGMNLVCKEFVAARDDQQGVLVLSRFAGAAREMTEALIVNPYHVEETADALLRAATMPAAEQRERMVSLRSTVREFNVFRWAARMLADAARWRLRARVEARVRRLGAG